VIFIWYNLIFIYFLSSHADGSIKFWDASASKFLIYPCETGYTLLIFTHGHLQLFSLGN
jgi:hypothetical protein